jgi:V/A-type H+-transporting ATPase subunit I
MAIAKLKLLDIEFSNDAYDAVLMKLINLDNFHPEPASKFADSVQGLSVLNRENPYADLISKMDEAKERFKIQYKDVESSDTRINIIQADKQFCDLIEKIDSIEQVQKELSVMIKENEETIIQLEHMINSDMDFDTLLGCKYLKVRFGSIPTNNLEKLQYFDSQEFFFKSFYKDPKITYCMYLTTQKRAPEIDNIFSSLYFENIQIPQFVHGTAESALSVLKEEDDTAKAYLATLQNRIDSLLAKELDNLSRIYCEASKLNEIYDAQKYVVVLGSVSAIYGFTEVEDAKKIKKDFEEIEGVHVEIKPATGDSRLTPPTKLKNNWFTRPFGMFVEMYGVPSYTDFDPTILVALSYTFLFGMMFGDVGQGIVLSIVGFIAYKLKGMRLGEVGMRLGVASMLFGILFGSVFGSEEIMKPFFVPMESENTMTLLGAAIGIGVTLIVISIIMNIIISYKKKKVGEMCFSQNGIAGLVFYVSILLIVVKMLLGISIPFVGTTAYILIFIIVPVLLMFLKEPLERKIEGESLFPDGFGGFFTESFFELFDVMLTFIANTMSFLRVGGFVLSHAGMMMVVYTLAKMVNGGIISFTIPCMLVLIFGNIFVMVLEGMIVGIQVLRLEFYEMFSRYYEGKGKPFVSIKER